MKRLALVAVFSLALAGKASGQDTVVTHQRLPVFPPLSEMMQLLTEPRTILPDTSLDFVFDAGIDRVVVRVGSTYAAFSRERVVGFLRQNPLRDAESDLEEFLAAPWNGPSYYGWLGQLMVTHRVAIVRPQPDGVYVFIRFGGPDDVVGATTSLELFNQRLEALVEALQTARGETPSVSG